MKRVLTVVLALFWVGLCFAQDGERDLYVTERDIPYHTEAGEYAAERCKLDFYYPVGEKGFPTVVWFHGGMPAPAHSVVKRYIRHICKGTLPKR